MGVTTISRKGRSNFYFSDSQMTFNHDLRIFIFGAEVTKHIRGSISITRNDRTSPGTMSFDLDNVNDIFTLTPRNKGYIVDSKGNYIKDVNAGSVDIGDSLSNSAKKKSEEIESEINNCEIKINECRVNNNLSKTKVATTRSAGIGSVAVRPYSIYNNARNRVIAIDGPHANNGNIWDLMVLLGL